MRKVMTGAAALALALAGAISGVSHIENVYAAQTYFIAPNGDDSHTCLNATTEVCQSLQHMTDLTVGGDTVEVTPGIYGPQTWNISALNPTGEAWVGSTLPYPIKYITVDFMPGAFLQRIPNVDSLPNQGDPLLAVRDTQGVIFQNLVAYGAKVQKGYVSGESPFGGEIHLTATRLRSGVNSVSMVSGGMGYTSPPSVTFTPADGNGSGAAGTATIDMTTHMVTGVMITNHGSNYTVPPLVGFSGGGGSGASATAAIDYMPQGCEDTVFGAFDSQCAQYVTLKNPTVQYSNGSCIESDFVFFTIDGANLHDCGLSGDGLDHGIYLTEHDDTVKNSAISGSTGFGIQMHNSGQDGGSGDKLLVQANTISANNYGGVYTSSGSATITGNYLHDNGSAGIREDGQGDNLTVTKNLIYNNTNNVGSTSGIVFNGNPGPNGADIENNTFYQDAAHPGGTDEIYTQSIPAGTGHNTFVCNIFSGISNYFDNSNSQETSTLSPKFLGTMQNKLSPIFHDNLYWNILQTAGYAQDTHPVLGDPRFIQEPLNFTPDTNSIAYHSCPGGGSIGALQP